ANGRGPPHRRFHLSRGQGAGAAQVALRQPAQRAGRRGTDPGTPAGRLHARAPAGRGAAVVRATRSRRRVAAAIPRAARATAPRGFGARGRGDRRMDRLTTDPLALVAGVDEAGRGPLAGPVVVAAVVFPAGRTPVNGLDDSK